MSLNIECVPDRRTNWFLTRMFARYTVSIDHRLWTVAEVADNGDFLAYRSDDEPGRLSCWDPDGQHGYLVGCAYYRWFPGSALIDENQDRWDNW